MVFTSMTLKKQLCALNKTNDEKQVLEACPVP